MTTPIRHLASGIWYLVSTLFLGLLLSSCANKAVRSYKQSLADGKYDSEFPSGSSSDEIGRVTRSVRKLYSVAHYTTFQFSRETNITPGSIRSGAFKKQAYGTISTKESVFGTATILYYDGAKMVLLTCAHVTGSPDTLVSYYEPTSEDPVPFIRSVSIREKQENWIKDLYECGTFDVIAEDRQKDIALLGAACSQVKEPAEPFPYKTGNAAELGWGSLVYILGYPMGNPVATRALASKPAPANPKEFTVDALLNKGFSGGVILAIRDGVPNFELVGMVKAVSSTEEYYLKPASDDRTYYQVFPYRGDIFVGTTESVQYGLNYVVPSEDIRQFIEASREKLVSAGYNPDALLK